MIPETYLQKEGMYRVAAKMSIKERVIDDNNSNNYNSTYVAAFMVVKK